MSPETEIDDLPPTVRVTVTCPSEPMDPDTGIGGCENGGVTIECTAYVGGSLSCGSCSYVFSESVPAEGGTFP